MAHVLYSIYICCLLFIINNVYAQAPDTVWEHCYGGLYQDQAQCVQPTADGGYVVLGSTGSNNYDVSGNHGNEDFWLLKLSVNGHIQWQKCLGGYSDDFVTGNVQQTTDKGYIVSGFSYSKDTTGSQVTGNHGATDYWVVKLDDKGNIIWEKSLGGSGDDASYSISQTKDGGYIVAGGTVSNDKQVSFNHGLIDAWILKLNDTGNIQWKKTYGGTGYDAANTIVQTTNGGYVFAGYTTSADSDLAGRPTADTSNTDLWVMRLDSMGNKIWSKWYGGSGEEEANAIKQTTDGGFIVTGYTTSNNRDVTGYHDSADCWLVKLDSKGILQWQKCLGGTGRDTANDIAICSDKGYVIAGFTTSNDGDVKGNHGNKDMWVVKVDSTGKPMWQKCLGGTKSDGAFSIANCADSAYILAGWSYTENNGDVHGHHNLGTPPNYDIDVWVVKLAYHTLVAEPLPYPNTVNIAVYPNPAQQSIAISTTYPASFQSVSLYNVLGQLIYTQEITGTTCKIDVAKWPRGLYTLEIKVQNNLIRKKLLIQ